MRILMPFALWLFAIAAWAEGRSPLTPEPHSLFLRVMDTGSGTATLTIVRGAPGTHRLSTVFWIPCCWSGRHASGKLSRTSCSKDDAGYCADEGGGGADHRPGQSHLDVLTYGPEPGLRTSAVEVVVLVLMLSST